MSGYVRIHRSLIDHPAFRNDAESMAFAWMIAKAAWAPRRVRYKERCITLNRGQLAVSQRDMARSLDRDKAWVERLWKRLKSEAMIEVSAEAGVAVVTICNYGEYQSEPVLCEAPSEAAHKAGARQGQGTEQGKGKRETREIGSAVEIPDWMPPSYAEFRAMRKAMRNVPFGEGAERRVIAKIERLRAEGHDPEKLLSKAIERGHRSVFEDESTKRSGPLAKPMNAEEQRAYAERYIAKLESEGRKSEAEEARRRYAVSVGEVVHKIIRAA